MGKKFKEVLLEICKTAAIHPKAVQWLCRCVKTPPSRSKKIALIVMHLKNQLKSASSPLPTATVPSNTSRWIFYKYADNKESPRWDTNAPWCRYPCNLFNLSAQISPTADRWRHFWGHTHRRGSIILTAARKQTGLRVTTRGTRLKEDDDDQSTR